MAETKVDTYKLTQYAQRLSRVNSRISNLDRRLDSLYWRVGLVGLWNLIIADSLTGYSWRLDRCRSYLEQTALEYDVVERYLSSSDILNYSDNISNGSLFDNYHGTNHRSETFSNFIGGLLSYFINGRNNSTPIGGVSKQDDKDVVKSILKFDSGFTKAISKWFKSSDTADEFKLSSSVFSYFSSLYTFYTTDYSDTSKLVSGGMKFTNASSSMFGGVYNYLEGNLKPLEASRFGKKFQTRVKTVSLIGNFLGFTGTNIESAKVWFDENSSGYDKFHATVNSLDSGLILTESAVNLKYGQKVLTRGVTGKYQWGTAAKNVKVLDNCNTGLALGSVVLGFVDGGVAEYEEVSADGVIDSNDRAQIGINGSVKGLTKIANFFTLGMSDAAGLSDSADEISDSIVNFAETTGADFVRSHEYSSNYVKNAQGLMDYANDENNPWLYRMAAEGTAGLGMIGAVTVDGIGEGCKWIGNEAVREWNMIKDFFS